MGKILWSEFNNVRNSLSTLVTNKKITSGVTVPSLAAQNTPVKVTKTFVKQLQDAVNALEGKFSNNCCESNHCQTCQSNKCEKCQEACSQCTDMCQSCQNACNQCTDICQTCQSNCYYQCDCGGNQSH